MGTMLIPDHTGHTTVSWEPGDTASEALAAERFSELRVLRLQPFRCEAPNQYVALASFDPAAEEILWVRPLQGG